MMIQIVTGRIALSILIRNKSICNTADGDGNVLDEFEWNSNKVQVFWNIALTYFL